MAHYNLGKHIYASGPFYGWQNRELQFACSYPEKNKTKLLIADIAPENTIQPTSSIYLMP